MRNKFLNFLIKTLTTKVAPMVYVMTFVSIVIGFCFATEFLMDKDESVLFRSGTLIPIPWWGFFLLFAATLTEVGLYFKRWNWVSTGAFLGFILWLLATIDLALSEHFYTMAIVGIFHLLFFGYVYLASSLRVLEREAI